jgi:hypothetical protein
MMRAATAKSIGTIQTTHCAKQFSARGRNGLTDFSTAHTAHNIEERLFMKFSRMNAVAPDSERIAALKASDAHRFNQLYGQATGELKRMAGLELRADGTVDVMQLDRALAGQPIERRMRLKGMLAELGAIPR